LTVVLEALSLKSCGLFELFLHPAVGDPVTKKEIVKKISERANLTQLKTKEIVQWTFDAIIDTLIEEGRIELRNFGVFEVRQRKARKARNPRTGESVEVKSKNVVTFQPGKEMEQEVRKAKIVIKKRRIRRASSRSQPIAEQPDTVLAGAAADSQPMEVATV
jgi:integration host factor subunit beta